MADKAFFRTASVILLLASGLLAGDASARKSDRNQDVIVAANATVAEQDERKPSVVTGNVVITQGTLVINAARGLITARDGEVTRLVLTGKPVRLQQQMDNGDILTVNASQADYNVATDIVVLTGDVRISQPTGNLAAPSAIYNMGTGRFESNAAKSNGRVKMRFVPRSQRGASK